MLLKRLFRDEKGAAGIFMLLFLFMVILGFSALVVDAGMLYTSRRQMVTAADAGALAGAQELEKTLGLTDALQIASIKAKAIQIAKDTAIRNGAQGEPIVEIKKMNVEVGAGVSDYRDVIVVTPKKTDSLFFARMLGFNTQDVSASAVATWGYVRKIAGGHLIPIYLTMESFLAGRDYLHSEKIIIDGTEYPNNTGYIYIDPAWKGQNDVNKALEGVSSKITMEIDQVFDAKAGLGQSLDGYLETRMQTANLLPTLIERQGYMHGLVPIVELAEGVNITGNSLKFRIKRFAVYEILDIIKDGASNNKIATGSPYALLGPDYHSVGNGNEKTYPKETYGVEFAKGTVIGRLTGEVRELEVDIQQGDQNDPSLDPVSAKYSKLVK